MKIIANPNWDKLGSFAAVGIAFALPTSTAITTYCAIIIFLSWLMGANHALKRDVLLRHPLTRWLAPLVFLTLLGTTYSDADFTSIRRAAMDGLRLGFIPFFIYYYRDPKIAKMAQWAFCLAMIVTLVLAFLKVYAGLPIGMKYTLGAVFKSHIKTSFFMAIAAYFLAYQIKALPRYRVVWISLIILMIYYLLCMSFGRIGYITMGACSVLLAWQYFRWQGIVAAVLLGLTLFGVAYSVSDVFSGRIDLLAQDLDFYHQGGRLEQSSLGSRLHFAHSSIEMIGQHPVLGSGTGSYGQIYSTLAQGANSLYTDNPHNEYLRVSVEQGLLGLVLLLMLFYQQIRMTQKIEPATLRGFSQGILLSFFIGCMFNSWLKDFTEGYFYCIMTAICFAGLPLRLPRLIQSVKVAVH